MTSIFRPLVVPVAALCLLPFAAITLAAQTPDFTKAEALIRQGQFDQSVALLSRILLHEPKNLQAHNLLGIALTSLAGAQAVPLRVRASSGVMQGMLVTRVNPQYSPEAKSQHVQGAVVLKVNIDKQGTVYKIEPISGHPLLAPAAIDAVKQWKYKPYLLNGTPVEVDTQVQVNFTLMP